MNHNPNKMKQHSLCSFLILATLAFPLSSFGQQNTPANTNHQNMPAGMPSAVSPAASTAANTSQSQRPMRPLKRLRKNLRKKIRARHKKATQQ